MPSADPGSKIISTEARTPYAPTRSDQDEKTSIQLGIAHHFLNSWTGVRRKRVFVMPGLGIGVVGNPNLGGQRFVAWLREIRLEASGTR